MILRDVMVPGKELRCDVCAFQWISINRELPLFCANRDCRSREWNGKKKRGGNKIKLPKPPKVRLRGEDDSDEF